MIYLDNNASTPVDPEVAEEVSSTLYSNFGNPSSTHYFGLKAKAAVEDARSRLASLIHADPEEIIFTSGGTESNNLAIIGTARKYKKGHIITSLIEHPSVLNPCKYLEDIGFDVTYLRVDSNGMISPDELRDSLRHDTVLITIMHANNETGVLQPAEEIGRIAKEKNIAFHTDAAQTVGKIPVDVRRLNVDMMTIVSHKFYGPKGIGAIYVRKGLILNPILFGARHERGLRPGTENVPGIAGIGKACELANKHINDRMSQSKKLTDMLYTGLNERTPSIILNGHKTLRLPNTLNVCIPGSDSIDLLGRIRDKVAASSGSACHSGVRKPSSILTAMGLSDMDAMSSVRLSTGKDNTEEEIYEAIEIISEAIKQMTKA